MLIDLSQADRKLIAEALATHRGMMVPPNDLHPDDQEEADREEARLDRVFSRVVTRLNSPAGPVIGLDIGGHGNASP